MAKMMGVNLNLSAIDKSKIFKGKKGSYIKLTLSINDQANDWGDNVSVWEEQSKEDRDAKVQRTFVGTGKVFWESDAPSGGQAQPQSGGQANIPVDEDSLPF